MREFRWVTESGVDRYFCGAENLCLVEAHVLDLGDKFSHYWLWRNDTGELLAGCAASSNDIRQLVEEAVAQVVSQPYDLPGDTIRHFGRQLTGVTLPITPAEWVDLCQSNGSFYLGGCCGRLSQAQDILNAIFRKGDLLSNELQLLFDWYVLVRGHDGYRPSDDYDVRQEAWYDPVARLIYLCEVLMGKLVPQPLNYRPWGGNPPPADSLEYRQAIIDHALGKIFNLPAAEVREVASPKDPLQEVQALTRLVRLADLFEDSHSDPEWREAKKKELTAALKAALAELEGEEATQG